MASILYHLLIGDIKRTWKNTMFIHVCCYGFSQGWKSLCNTVVFMINNISSSFFLFSSTSTHSTSCCRNLSRPWSYYFSGWNASCEHVDIQNFIWRSFNIKCIPNSFLSWSRRKLHLCRQQHLWVWREIFFCCIQG